MTVATTEIKIEPKHPSRFEKNRNICGGRSAGHPLLGSELAVSPAFFRLSPRTRSPACAKPEGRLGVSTHRQLLDPILDLGHRPAGGEHPVDLLPRVVHCHLSSVIGDSPAGDVPQPQAAKPAREGRRSCARPTLDIASVHRLEIRSHPSPRHLVFPGSCHVFVQG